MRKTLGGLRGQLIGQFMTETSLIVLIAVFMGGSLSRDGSPYAQVCVRGSRYTTFSFESLDMGDF